MGWDFTDGATKKDVIAEITGGSSSTLCLAHTVRGNVLWTVMETAYPSLDGAMGVSKKVKWIGCYLLGATKGSWGYKAMDEAMHPYYYNCPLSYLEMAPVASAAWREGVLAAYTRAKVKLKVGDKVKLVSGCAIPEVTVTSVSPLRAVANGKEYKLPRRLIESVLPSSPEAA